MYFCVYLCKYIYRSIYLYPIYTPLLATIYIYICAHSKISLSRTTMGLILNDPFREVVGFGSYIIITIVLYGRSLGTQVKRSICRGGQLERFYCVYAHLYFILYACQLNLSNRPHPQINHSAISIALFGSQTIPNNNILMIFKLPKLSPP